MFRVCYIKDKTMTQEVLTGSQLSEILYTDLIWVTDLNGTMIYDGRR